MNKYDIYSLILYKQHYRDDYTGRKALSDDIFSSFGYYDGFKVECGDNCNKETFIETLYDKTHKPIEKLNGKYGIQIVGMFRTAYIKIKKDTLDTYKNSLFAAVGFVQINEMYDIKADPGLSRLIKKLEKSDRNILVFGTFDNADLIILIKGYCLQQINSIIDHIDAFDEVSYMHTITGISQMYLNNSAKKKKMLQMWNSHNVDLNETVDEFYMRIAARNKNYVISVMQSIVEKKYKSWDLNSLKYIKESIQNCDKFIIYGHHDIELIFKCAPLEFILFSMLPGSLLSHDNGQFGKNIYNIESGYKYQAKGNEQYANEAKESKHDTNKALRIKDLMDEIRKRHKPMDDPVIQALYNSLNTLAQFEGFQLADDIFCLVYPAINNFLNQYFNSDLNKQEENISEMIEYINSVVQHSVHTDQIFLMIPGYCGSSFGLPTKLSLFYQWMAYEVKYLLMEENHQYDVLLSPEAKIKPETKEIRYGISEHTIIVRFGQKMLFQPDFCIILVHELAHYIGEKDRQREIRAEKCIKLTAALMVEMIFRDSKYISEKDKFNVLQYKKKVNDKIEQYITFQIKNLTRINNINCLYASELRYMLKQITYHIICLDERDSMFEDIFLPADVAVKMIGNGNVNNRADKQKATQVYCKTIDKILQNCKQCLFEETMDIVIDNLITTFKEIYSDVCAYEILKFDFQTYQRAFRVSENREIEPKNIPPMQSIREFVMHQLIGVKETYHSEWLELTDTYFEDQMFSYEYVQAEFVDYAKQCRFRLNCNFEDPIRKMKAQNIRSAYNDLKNRSTSRLYKNVLEKVYLYKSSVKNAVFWQPDDDA